MNPIVVPDYHLIVKCGRGAFGDVYVAESLSGSRVALKIIEKTTHSAKEFDGLKYYCSRCGDSQYLIKIFHTGETESFFYYTMELADNCGDENNYVPATLANRLMSQKRLPPAQVRDLALDLLSGLKTLHDAGLVHRDIKPENIIFVNGKPKLSDIGLVSAVSATFSLEGTLGFIPPERFKSSNSSTKSATDDLYAMGKLIYCVFTGNSPDKFPSIPQDIVLDEDTKKLNEVILIACSKVSRLRFNSIDKFRKALLTSVSKKQKTLNFIWTYRYYWLIGMVLYMVFTTVLWLEINKSTNVYEYDKIEMSIFADGASRKDYGRISTKDRVDHNGTRLPSAAANVFGRDDWSNRETGAFQKIAGGAAIPSIISDAEFKTLMTKTFEGNSYIVTALTVNNYLFDKGCRKFPELQTEFAAYLANIAAIEKLMFKLMPEKIAEIKTLARNNVDIMSIPLMLASRLSFDTWNDKKMRSLYCSCAIRVENIKVIFLEKRNLLPEALEWDNYVLNRRKDKNPTPDPTAFKNPSGGETTDFESALASYKNLLQNSPPDKKGYYRKIAERFLASLKFHISTPEIVALEAMRTPFEMRLAVAKETRDFLLRNIDDYVICKYGTKTWSFGERNTGNYNDIQKRINDGINNLPAVRRLSEWTMNKGKRLAVMREKELANMSNPQVAVYLKAEGELAPCLQHDPAEKTKAQAK